MLVYNEFSRQWRYRSPILILVNTNDSHLQLYILTVCVWVYKDRNIAGSSEIEKEKETKKLSDKIIAAYKFFAYVILVLCMCGMLSFSFPRVFGLVIIIITTIFFHRTAAAAASQFTGKRP